SMLLSPATTSGGSYANLFDAHPPFQIDGNFGGAAGIVEMLVQSHTSYIDILPALPSSLKSGSMSGVKLRGGFQADLSWDEHQLSTFVITSQAGNTLRLKYKDKTIQLETKPGASYAFDGELSLVSE
ncbi:MAG TPA: glycoside hydrolase family 95 protein, partial [Candidatus Sphingobacterium stercoripullorum]|nr:glycoside hydrolase family 95 protein [Candidatus Sphingobacterium stercoripullorum]